MPKIATIQSLWHGQKWPYMKTRFSPSPSWEAGDCSHLPPMAHRELGPNNCSVQHQECVSVPSPLQVSDHWDEVKSLLALCLAHWCASYRRVASPTSARGTLLTPRLAGMCQQSRLQGVSELLIGVRWNVWLYTCGLQTWTHSLLPIRVLNLLPVINVSLWCPGSAHGSRSPGQQFR